MWPEKQIFAVVLKEGKTTDERNPCWRLWCAHFPCASGRQWFGSEVTTLCMLGETTKTRDRRDGIGGVPSPLPVTQCH